MESLFILGLLFFLIGPILGIAALVQISNLSNTVRRLKSDVDRLSEVPRPLASAAPLAEAQHAPFSKSEKIEEPVAVQNDPLPAELITEQTDHTAIQPEPASAWSSKRPPKAPRDMEKALASRWFVWLGGAAIAMAGLLFVKYAHDQGLIPPIIRVIFGWAVAAGLVVAGEFLRKRNEALAASYIPAAVSAAGLVIGFGVTYAAYALYGILPAGICFVVLVGIGLGALWLSRKQGPLIAALGLLGSYGAPALVPSENPSAFGFFAYLIVIASASLFELRNRSWWWLGYAGIAGALAWAVMWIVGGSGSSLPVGVFALLLGCAATFLPVGTAILKPEMGSLLDPKAMWQPMRIAVFGIAAAGLILALSVVQSQHAAHALATFAVGMVALVGFGWMRQGMVAAPLAAALLSFITLMLWPDAGFLEFAMDENGLWSTVPGQIQPPKFRNAMLIAMAGFTAIGVAGVLFRAEKRAWAALAAASSVAFLFGAWAQADFSLKWSTWVILAALVATVLLWSADRVKDTASRATEFLLIGVTLLALFAIDRSFDGVWQTIAIAVLAVAAAFATRRFQVPWLGAIASAVAGIAAARLFLGREFWGDPKGLPLGAHWPIYGYGVPALLFWQGSRWLNGTGFARYRVALEGLALGLAISLVSLELRVFIGGGITADRFTLLELGSHAIAWLGAAYGLAYRQTLFSSLISLWGARVLLAASCLAFVAALTARNPTLTGDLIHGSKLFNSLWLAYLAPVPLLALMARKLEGLGIARLRSPLGIFALILLITFATLFVMNIYQGPFLKPYFESDAESYTVSVVWLALAIAIFIAGIKLDRQTIRLAGLAVMILAVLKVFIFDLNGIGGLFRIASFAGLGLCLLGVGWLYTRYVAKPSQPLTAN